MDSLLGQYLAGLEQESIQRRVLIGDQGGSGGALQVKTPYDDVEDGGQGGQLHAVKHRQQGQFLEGSHDLNSRDRHLYGVDKRGENAAI